MREQAGDAWKLARNHDDVQGARGFKKSLIGKLQSKGAGEEPSPTPGPVCTLLNWRNQFSTMLWADFGWLWMKWIQAWV